MGYARNQLGMRGGFIRPNPYNNRMLNDPAYEPLWAEAQELDFSIGVHEGTGGMPATGTDRVQGFGARHIVSHTLEMMLASLNLIWGGVCERYPKLRSTWPERNSATRASEHLSTGLSRSGASPWGST